MADSIFVGMPPSQFSQDLATTLNNADANSRRLLGLTLQQILAASVEKTMNLFPVSLDEFWIRMTMPFGFLAIRFRRDVYATADANNLGRPAGGRAVYVWRRTGQVAITSLDTDPTVSPLFVFSLQDGAQDYALAHFVNPNNIFAGSFHGGEVAQIQRILCDGIEVDITQPQTMGSFRLERTSLVTWSDLRLNVDYVLETVAGSPGRMREVIRTYNPLSNSNDPLAGTNSTGGMYYGMEMPERANFDSCDYNTAAAGVFAVTLGSTDLDLASAGAVTKTTGVAPWGTRVRFRNVASGYYLESTSDAPTSLAGAPGAYARTWLLRAGAGQNKLYMERGSTSGGNTGDRTVTRFIQHGKLTPP